MDFYERVLANEEPFIIAEIGSNHNGDMNIAKRLIDDAAEAGCDAVKFQSWDWDTLFSKAILEKNKEMVAKDVDAKGLEAVQKKLALSDADHRMLKKYCDKKGILFSSSAFTTDKVNLLANLGVPYIKIASLDVTNIPLLKHAARTGLPILLSIGMATEDEIRQAVDAIRGEGNNKIVLLHCVAVYPPADEIVNLRTMEWLRDTFDVAVGYSDHTNSLTIPIASAALGANVIEKHFMLGGIGCRDELVSLNPEQMKQMVAAVRSAARARGRRARVLTEEELQKSKVMRRSILTKSELKAGTVLTENNIVLKRPGTGISPARIEEVIGKKLKVDKDAEEIINWEDLD